MNALLWSVALGLAGLAAGGTALAQTEIDVRTIVSVPPQEEAPATPPSAARADVPPGPSPAVMAPWDAPPFRDADPSVATPPASVAAASEQHPATTAGFTGSATALPCRPAGYVTIIDERSDLRAGTLCPLADGSWQLLP